MSHRRLLTLTALCALAAGFAAVVPAADAQPAQHPTWHISTEVTNPPSGLMTLYEVTAVRGQAWAAGQGGPTGYGPQIEEWNGKIWIDRTPAHLNTGQISVIGMSGPGNVWAAAGDVGNYALRWDGRKWSYFPFHTTVTPTGLAVFSPRNVWVFGYYGQYAAFVRQFDGRHWHRIGSPIVPLAASGVSAHDIWTVGAVGHTFATNPNDYPSALANWNGFRWHTVRLPYLHIGRKQVFQPMGITALGPRDVWVDGEVNSQSGYVNVRSLLLHWNGRRWGLFRSPVNELAQVAPDGGGGVWLTADPIVSGRADLVHFRNSKWTVIPAPLPAGEPNDSVDLYGLVHVPGTTQEWAGGWIAQPSSLPLGLVDVFSP